MPREAIATRFLNRPLALLPAFRPFVLSPDEADGPGRQRVSRGAGLVGTIAVIPVLGILVHGAGYGFGFGETSYGSIRTALAEAVDDDSVTGIALHIDSPGGEVSGCPDLADALYAARSVKPLHAIVDDMAASAAYWLASACSRITVSRTGTTGSIGVLGFRADVTRALDMAGVDVTTLQYGEQKTDTLPTTKLTRAARDRLQAEVDQMGDLFVEAVARNRALRVQAVRDTQAGTFLGREGVRAGLADAVASADTAFLALMDAAAERGPVRSSARTASTSRKGTRPMNPNFAHLRPSASAEAHSTSAAADPDALMARRILRAHAKARGEEPHDGGVAGPRQPGRYVATAAEILAADKKRRGIA